MNVPANLAEEAMVVLIDHPRLHLEAPVRSIAEASAIYARMRDASGEGGSTFPPGAIFIEGIETHRISYNARVWRWHGPRGDEYDLAYDPAAFESPETADLLRYC